MPQQNVDNKTASQNADLAKRAQLPNDIEAEQAVLAACLLSRDVCDEMVAGLKPENFFRMSHRTIFETIVEMMMDSLEPDVIALADKLNTKGQLEAIGGRQYLLDLNANTFALTNWERHMEIVKRTSIQRDLIRAAAEINALAYDAPEGVSQVVDEAERALFEVTENQVSSSFEPIESLVHETLEELDAISKQKGSIVGVPTGFKDLDDIFHGFRGGDLIILGARPSIGKTAFALNLAVNAAMSGAVVAFFSLEMKKTQLVQRIVCAEAMVPLEKVRSGNVDTADWSAMADAADRLISKCEIQIDDTSSLSLMEARAKVRRELRRLVGTDKKALIVIDYLQLMQPGTARRDGRHDLEIGEISRGLKILAKEMNMPVLALAQLSRGIENRKGKRPMLSDLRDSGNIEQDADIVMFLDRSRDEMEAASSDRPDLGTAEVIVAKHRNGRTGSVTLAFDDAHTKFNNFIDSARVGEY